MSTKLYRNASNYHEINDTYGIETGETPVGESLTIPEQTLTLKDIVQRHRSGQYVPVKDAQYEEYKENIKFPDLTKMSKIEVTEFAHELQQTILDNRKILEKYVQVKSNKGDTTQENAKNSSGAGETNEGTPQ